MVKEVNYNSWSRDAINKWASFLQNSWNFCINEFFEFVGHFIRHFLLLDNWIISTNDNHFDQWESFLPTFISKNNFSAFIFIVSINSYFTPSKIDFSPVEYPIRLWVTVCDTLRPVLRQAKVQFCAYHWYW